MCIGYVHDVYKLVKVLIMGQQAFENRKSTQKLNVTPIEEAMAGSRPTQSLSPQTIQPWCGQQQIDSGRGWGCWVYVGRCHSNGKLVSCMVRPIPFSSQGPIPKEMSLSDTSGWDSRNCRGHRAEDNWNCSDSGGQLITKTTAFYLNPNQIFGYFIIRMKSS